MEKITSKLKDAAGGLVPGNDVVTLATGAPVSDARNSLTAGPHGPVLMQDVQLLEKLAAFDRERIPERVVHALGHGAHGRFTVTSGEFSRYCKAAVFKPGTETETFVRFSLVAPERGGADLLRDVRGFAVKFYSTEGNWDLVCNNHPVFWIRDPMLFPDVNHVLKRNPQTDMADASAMFDFLAATPESIHTFLMVYGDRGIPFSFRHMNGYGNHAFRTVNDAGEAFYVKFHFHSDAGVKNVTSDAAELMRGRDPDHARRDLVNHLAAGTASWTLKVQVVPEEDVANYNVDIFDVTKVIPHSDYPLMTVGKLVLERNVDNFFSEVEQSAFSPATLVPGIEASPDRILQARLFSYRDTQFYRLGSANFMQLPINKPLAVCPARNVYRDGAMSYSNPGAEPHYFTGLASTGGPQRVSARAGAGTDLAAAMPVDGGKAARYDQRDAAAQRGKVDDFAQPRALYTRVMTDGERRRLEANIIGHLKDASAPVQARFIAVLERVDGGLASRVQAGIAAVASGTARVVPTHGKFPSSHTPNLKEIAVKTGTTVFAMPDAPEDSTAAQPGAVNAGAGLEAKLQKTTLGGQPGLLKSALGAVAAGVTNLTAGAGAQNEQ